MTLACLHRLPPSPQPAWMAGPPKRRVLVAGFVIVLVTSRHLLVPRLQAAAAGCPAAARLPPRRRAPSRSGTPALRVPNLIAPNHRGRSTTCSDGVLPATTTVVVGVHSPRPARYSRGPPSTGQTTIGTPERPGTGSVGGPLLVGRADRHEQGPVHGAGGMNRGGEPPARKRSRGSMARAATTSSGCARGRSTTSMPRCQIRQAARQAGSRGAPRAAARRPAAPRPSPRARPRLRRGSRPPGAGRAGCRGRHGRPPLHRRRHPRPDLRAPLDPPGRPPLRRDHLGVPHGRHRQRERQERLRAEGRRGPRRSGASSPPTSSCPSTSAATSAPRNARPASAS